MTPEVTLPDLETIEAEKTLYKATEEMRDENIARLLESAASSSPPMRRGSSRRTTMFR